MEALFSSWPLANGYHTLRYDGKFGLLDSRPWTIPSLHFSKKYRVGQLWIAVRCVHLQNATMHSQELDLS